MPSPLLHITVPSMAHLEASAIPRQPLRLRLTDPGRILWKALQRLSGTVAMLNQRLASATTPEMGPN